MAASALGRGPSSQINTLQETHLSFQGSELATYRRSPDPGPRNITPAQVSSTTPDTFSTGKLQFQLRTNDDFCMTHSADLNYCGAINSKVHEGFQRALDGESRNLSSRTTPTAYVEGRSKMDERWAPIGIQRLETDLPKLCVSAPTLGRGAQILSRTIIYYNKESQEWVKLTSPDFNCHNNAACEIPADSVGHIFLVSGDIDPNAFDLTKLNSFTTVDEARLSIHDTLNSQEQTGSKFTLVEGQSPYLLPPRSPQRPVPKARTRVMAAASPSPAVSAGKGVKIGDLDISRGGNSLQKQSMVSNSAGQFCASVPEKHGGSVRDILVARIQHRQYDHNGGPVLKDPMLNNLKNQSLSIQKCDDATGSHFCITAPLDRSTNKFVLYYDTNTSSWVQLTDKDFTDYGINACKIPTANVGRLFVVSGEINPQEFDPSNFNSLKLDKAVSLIISKLNRAETVNYLDGATPDCAFLHTQSSGEEILHSEPSTASRYSPVATSSRPHSVPPRIRVPNPAPVLPDMRSKEPTVTPTILRNNFATCGPFHLVNESNNRDATCMFNLPHRNFVGIQSASYADQYSKICNHVDRNEVFSTYQTTPLASSGMIQHCPIPVSIQQISGGFGQPYLCVTAPRGNDKGRLVVYYDSNSSRWHMKHMDDFDKYKDTACHIPSDGISHVFVLSGKFDQNLLTLEGLNNQNEHKACDAIEQFIRASHVTDPNLTCLSAHPPTYQSDMIRYRSSKPRPVPKPRTRTRNLHDSSSAAVASPQTTPSSGVASATPVHTPSHSASAPASPQPPRASHEPSKGSQSVQSSPLLQSRRAHMPPDRYTLTPNTGEIPPYSGSSNAPSQPTPSSDGASATPVHTPSPSASASPSPHLSASAPTSPQPSRRDHAPNERSGLSQQSSPRLQSRRAHQGTVTSGSTASSSTPVNLSQEPVRGPGPLPDLSQLDPGHGYDSLPQPKYPTIHNCAIHFRNPKSRVNNTQLASMRGFDGHQTFEKLDYGKVYIGLYDGYHSSGLLRNKQRTPSDIAARSFPEHIREHSIQQAITPANWQTIYAGVQSEIQSELGIDARAEICDQVFYWANRDFSETQAHKLLFPEERTHKGLSCSSATLVGGTLHFHSILKGTITKITDIKGRNNVKLVHYTDTKGVETSIEIQNSEGPYFITPQSVTVDDEKMESYLDYLVNHPDDRYEKAYLFNLQLPNLNNMTQAACSVATCVIEDGVVKMAHAGDALAFVMSDKKTDQLNHRGKILTQGSTSRRQPDTVRCLGTADPHKAKPVLCSHSLEAKDKYVVLCSNGVVELAKAIYNDSHPETPSSTGITALIYYIELALARNKGMDSQELVEAVLTGMLRVAAHKPSLFPHTVPPLQLIIANVEQPTPDIGSMN